MSENVETMVEKHLRNIHKYRSPISCSSAILAVEVILCIHTQNKYRAELERAKSELKASNEKEKREEIDRLTAKIKQSHRINLVFLPRDIASAGEKTSNTSARFIRRSGNIPFTPEYSIVLPEHLRDIILEKDFSIGEEWDNEAKNAKRKLRERTAHELAHLLYQVIEEGADKPSDGRESEEEEAFNRRFIESFVQQPVAWIDGIPYPGGAVKIEPKLD